ncbi:MAG: transporter substrate-binding domain-containing protein [Pseudomonadales bacterium]|nr:transporter substrate-binding domain-containing protein [Pseudomonadales bacterium]
MSPILTAEELRLSQNNAPLKICIEEQFKKTLQEAWKIFNRDSQLSYEWITFDTTQPLLDLISSQRCDIFPAMMPSLDKEKYLDFSTAYFDTPSVLVALNSRDTLNSFDESKHGIHLMFENYYMHNFYQTDLSSVKRRTVKSWRQIIRLLRNKEADFLAISALGFRQMQVAESAYDLHIVYQFSDKYRYKSSIATIKNKPWLKAIVQKQVSTVKNLELLNLLLQTEGKRQQASILSNQQRAFLSNKQRLKLCLNRHNVEYQEQFWKVFNEKLGINYQIISVDLSKPIKDIMAKHHCDVFPVLMPHADSKSYLDFSSHYISSPFVLALMNSQPFIIDVSTMAGEKIAAVSGYVIGSLLAEKYPAFNLIYFPSFTAALQALRQGDVKAIAVNAANFHGNQLMESAYDIKIGAQFPENFRLQASIATDIKQPELAKIMQKVVETTTEAKIRQTLESLLLKQTKPETIILSKDEHDFIAGHAPFRVCIQKQGSDDIKAMWNFFNKQLLLKTEFYEVEVYEQFDFTQENDKHDCDIWPYITKTRKRQKSLSFTDAYAKEYYVIVTTDSNQDIHSIEDLNNKTVVSIKHFAIVDSLKASFPNIRILKASSIKVILEALRSGQADAFITTASAFSVFQAETLAVDLKISGQLPETLRLQARMATNKSDRLMNHILVKMLKATPAKEITKLKQAMIKRYQVGKNVILSKKERKFIQKHGLIKVCVRDYLTPKKFLKAQERELWQLFNRDLSLPFSFVITENYVDFSTLIKNKTCELWPLAGITESRAELLAFTTPYSSVPYVLVTNKHQTYIDDVSEFIKKKRVAVTKGWAVHEYLQRTYPNAELILVEDIYRGLEMVLQGKVDAFVANGEVVALATVFFGDVELKNSGFLTIRNELAIASNKELPELLSISQKLVDNIQQAELHSLIFTGVNKLKHNPINLSDSEREALENSDEITVCVYKGIIVYQEKFWRLFSRHLGLKNRYKIMEPGKKWHKDCDVIPMTVGGSAGANFLFTDPFISHARILYRLEEQSYLSDIKNMAGLRVAAIRNAEGINILRQEFPKLDLVAVNDFSDAVNQLRVGKVDAFLASSFFGVVMADTEVLSGIKVAAQLAPELNLNSMIAVNRKKAYLQPILQKAINYTTAADVKAIIYPEKKSSNIHLSYQQLEFLKKLGPIKVCIQPNNNGIEIAYWNLLNKRLEAISLVIETDSIKDMYTKLRIGKCDIYPTAGISSEHKDWLTYSYSNLSFPYLLMIKKEKSYINSNRDLAGLNIAVREGTAMMANMHEFYPEIELIAVNNMISGLTLVKSGEAGAFMDYSPMFNLTALQLVMQGLKVGGQLDRISHKVAIAVRSERPELLAIMNKLIKVTPLDEVNDLLNSYQRPQEKPFNYRLLWKVAAAVVALMLFIIAWNRYLAKVNRNLNLANNQTHQAQDLAEQALAKVAELLNSSGEGFLSMTKNLIVEEQYSTKCLKILQQSEISGVYFPELLFVENDLQKSTFSKGCKLIFTTTNSVKLGFLLDLLPREVELEGKTLKVNYHFNDNRLILIIKDISKQVHLAQQVEAEKNKLEKLVYAMINRSEVLKVCSEFQQLLKQSRLQHNAENVQQTVDYLYRQIHTYKSLFMQMHFSQLAEKLHALEDTLKTTVQNRHETLIIQDGNIGAKEGDEFNSLAVLIAASDIDVAFQLEKQTLLDKMGTDYFDDKTRITIDSAQLQSLKVDVEKLEDSTVKKSLFNTLNTLSSFNLADRLQLHLDSTEDQAIRLGKQLEASKVQGPQILLDSELYSAFVHSLVHVFRNAVSHGIEMPDQRLSNNKNVRGLIDCRIEEEQKNIHICISDDGAGIDINALNEQKNRTDALSIDPQTSFQALFKQGVSSKQASDLYAGRGIGLAAVWEEINKLDGQIEVNSQPGKGTSFTFSFKKADNAF